MKKMLGLGLVVVLVGGYLLFNYAHASSAESTVDIVKWKHEAPRLFNNVGYADLVESAPRAKDMPESWIELRGTITNPFGIRDDLLEYILANVPESNVRDTRALIKMVQYDQEIYYTNPSESDALLIASRADLANTCFSGDIHKLLEIDKLYRNTDARNKHMWAIDRKYFSWKVLGTGLSLADEKIACERGWF